MLNDCRDYEVRISGRPVNVSGWAGMPRRFVVLGEGDQAASAPAEIWSICLAGSEVSAFAGLDIAGKCLPAALFQGRSDCRAVRAFPSFRGQGRSGAATARALPSCRGAFDRPGHPERYSILMPAPTALFPFGQFNARRPGLSRYVLLLRLDEPFFKMIQQRFHSKVLILLIRIR